jgi:opacity protein-like surface antigen
MSSILKNALLMCCIFAYVPSTFAEQDILKNNRYVFGLDLGISVVSDLGNATSFPLGYSTFSYHPQSKTLDPLRYGASFSRHMRLSDRNAMEIGISYHSITQMHVNGTLEQGISPPYYSAGYQYSVKTSQLLAEAKLIREWRDVLYPYLMGGIGVGMNAAQNYSTSIPDFLTITPIYANRSNTAFSYTVGLGIDYFVAKPLSLGLGYRFSDLGSVGLGNGAVRYTAVTSPLKQSHVYLNTLLIEANYFF